MVIVAISVGAVDLSLLLKSHISYLKIKDFTIRVNWITQFLV